MELATLGFVERKQGVILAGNSGTGKSHIAKALLLLGCRKLYRCRYTTASAMLGDLRPMAIIAYPGFTNCPDGETGSRSYKSSGFDLFRISIFCLWPKYYVDDVEVTVVTERVQYLDADGKLITESLKDYTRKTVRKAYTSMNAFLNAWKDADRKQVIMEELSSRGVFFDELAVEQWGQTYISDRCQECRFDPHCRISASALRCLRTVFLGSFR